MQILKHVRKHTFIGLKFGEPAKTRIFAMCFS